MSAITLSYANTDLSLNDYSNVFFNASDGRSSTVVQESAPIYTYVKDFNSENSNHTYAVHTNRMKMHTRNNLVHSCSLDALQKDIVKYKEIPTKFPTNIGKEKKCHSKLEGGRQFYHLNENLSSVTISNALRVITWSDVKFPSRKFLSKKILKDCSVNGISNDTSSIKYITETLNADDAEIISDNSFNYIREFSNADNYEIISDTSIIKNNKDDLSHINSSYINFLSRQSTPNEISKDYFREGNVSNTFSRKYIKNTSNADDNEIRSDNSLIKYVTEFSNADDNEIVSDTFLNKSREDLWADDNEVVKNSYASKCVSELSDEKITNIHDTPKIIHLKQTDNRRKSKRIPIRLANLPRKTYIRNKNEIRIMREDIKNVEPNSDNETFDINKFLRKTRRKLSFSADDAVEKNSEISVYNSEKEHSIVMNGSTKTSDVKKLIVTKSNEDSKQNSKALENIMNGLGKTINLKNSIVTKSNENSKQKSKALENITNGLAETMNFKKSTVTKSNENSKQKSKTLEKPDTKFVLESYIDKLKDVVRKPPMTKRAKAFEEKTYPKVYFDFDDYCMKIFSLKKQVDEKSNNNISD